MIIGISGGTGSGKTTVAQKIVASVGTENIVYIAQDSYYRNLGDMPHDSRQHVNFDHPDALDLELMLSHLEALSAGRSIEQPVYDFTGHTRKAETKHIECRPVILVEGILVFIDPRMRRLMNLKIFIDCDADIRFIRRLERDIRERGRSVESVVAQYTATVRPMHLQYVEPCIRYADMIIPEGGINNADIDRIITRIRSVLASSKDHAESQTP
jgi:uridine kinase